MPTLSDLDAAMLHPGRAVPAVNRLGGGAIAMTAPDRPWRVVGASAAVYQLRQPSGNIVALRCLLAEPDEIDPALGARYRALGTDPALAALRGDGRPLVGALAFLADGLSLPAADFRSATHPLIAMEWVMGPTLLAVVDRACRGDDGLYVDALADAWATTMATVTEARFDHGNLTADNVLVWPSGGLALVDYDTCVWPGAPAPPTVTPAPGYAHPSGGVAPAGRRDLFPSLVVYVSLRVLARWPALRETYGDRPGGIGGVLLFGARDLRDPDVSPLFVALRTLDDPSLRWLVGLLREVCRGPVGEVPALARVVDRLRQGVDGGGQRPPRPVPDDRGETAAAPTAAPTAGVTRERQQQLTRLNSLLLAGDEEGARRFWSESGLERDSAAVRELGPRMAELTRRRLLRQAREAAEEGDSATLLRLWREGRFDDYRPATPLAPMVDAARRRGQAVVRLREALDRNDIATVVRLWPELRGDSLASPLAIRAQTAFARHVGTTLAAVVARGDDAGITGAVREAEASGVAIDVPTRRAARAAAARLETRRLLGAAVEADDRPTLAMLAISGRLEELGMLEPPTMRAILRALAWPHLERALDSGEDAAILAAYDGDLFDGDDALTLDHRARVDLARRRSAWLEEVRGSLRRRNVAALRGALAKTPPGAERRLSRVERNRIERLVDREESVERLATALRDGPDAAIIDALSRVEAAGAALPEALDWAAVRGVVDRMTLVEAVRGALAANPADYAQLARLLPAVRAATGAGAASGGHDAGGTFDFARLEADVLRAAHLDRLREALAGDDDAAIVAAARPDPYGALARLTETQRARVWRALGVRGGSS